MRRRSELMQFEIGMSTSRYFPARGTAGLARSLVSGNSRVPAPPPRISDRTLLVFGDILTAPGVEAIRVPPAENSTAGESPLKDAGQVRRSKPEVRSHHPLVTRAR